MAEPNQNKRPLLDDLLDDSPLEAKPEKVVAPQASAKGSSAWVVGGVVLLAVVAIGGWVAYLLTNWGPQTTNQINQVNQTETSLPPASQLPPRSTPRVGSPAPSSAVGTAPTIKTALAYGVVVSRVLNIREGPTTAAPVVRPLKSGDIVELVRRNGGWYQTTEGAWISAIYLEVRLTRAEAESYARELKG